LSHSGADDEYQAGSGSRGEYGDDGFDSKPWDQIWYSLSVVAVYDEHDSDQAADTEAYGDTLAEPRVQDKSSDPGGFVTL
jgi:hypothetical protein